MYAPNLIVSQQYHADTGGRYAVFIHFPDILYCYAAAFSGDGHGGEAAEHPLYGGWPKLPSPFIVRNWEDTVREVTLLTLDANASSPYFPVSAYFQQETPLFGGAQGQQFGVQTYLRSRATPHHYQHRPGNGL